MQRFRVMNMYVAGMVLLILLTIGGTAWLRRPDVAAATDDQVVPSAAGTAAITPADVAPPPPTHGATHATVSIDNFVFTPKILSVSVGSTVTWINHDDVPHTATSNGGPATFDSKALDTDDKYAFTFTTPGTYSYYCRVHTHMTGTVVVK